MNLTDITRLQATVDDVIQAGITSEEQAWYIARVTPGREGKALSGLRERGIGAYLPCETRWTSHGRKREKGAFAVFPGYLFVSITPRQSLYEVRQVDAVTSFVGQGSPLRLSARTMAWLGQLRTEELQGAFDKTRPKEHRFDKGQKVRIIEPGPLEGQTGVVVEMTPDKRIRVMLNAAIGWDYCAANDKVELVVANDEGEAQNRVA